MPSPRKSHERRKERQNRRDETCAGGLIVRKHARWDLTRNDVTDAIDGLAPVQEVGGIHSSTRHHVHTYGYVR